MFIIVAMYIMLDVYVQLEREILIRDGWKKWKDNYKEEYKISYWENDMKRGLKWQLKVKWDVSLVKETPKGM